ncbi:MAG: MarR family winged helix-turn-helix transcriptional regulator [Sphingomonadaceae bacterium]|jgi:DNA-binding MarR family transcriptional regulator
MENSLLLLDMMRTFLQMDEKLRERLQQRGWPSITRSQSMVLANVANGVTRASRLAENLGVTRQAMSQLLADMVKKGLIELIPDPDHGRAQLVQFAPQADGIREDARRVLRDLEAELEISIGAQQMASLRQAFEQLA